MRHAFVLLLLASFGTAQDPVPPLYVIVGHTTHDTVRVNVTTAQPLKGELQIGGIKKPFETTVASRRRTIVTFPGLTPRTPYSITFQGKPVAQFRTMPKPGDAAPLRIGFGSCLMAFAKQVAQTQPDKQRTMVDNFKILPQLADEKLDAFLWIGDRFYTPSIYEAYANATVDDARDAFWKLHDMTMQLGDVRKLLRSTPNYVIWDDHDFGPDNSSGHFKFKQVAMETLVQGYANPAMGEKGNPGCYFKLTIGALDLFLLDNRWHRGCAGLQKTLRNGQKIHSCTPVVEQRADGGYSVKKPLDAVYGKQQMDWLKAGLTASKARFKLVIGGGQMLSDIHRFEAWYHSGERDAFLKWMRASKVPGVVFVAGDRHHGEIGVLKTGGPYPLYEITASGLGVNVYPLDADTPQSPYDIVAGKGSVHHYGVIEFDGSDLSLVLMGEGKQELGRKKLTRANLEPAK